MNENKEEKNNTSKRLSKKINDIYEVENLIADIRRPKRRRTTREIFKEFKIGEDKGS